MGNGDLGKSVFPPLFFPPVTDIFVPQKAKPHLPLRKEREKIKVSIFPYVPQFTVTL